MKWIGLPVAEISPFEIQMRNGRSSVGRQYIPTLISYTSHIDLLFATFMNVAREE